MKRVNRSMTQKLWTRVQQSTIVAALVSLGCILQGCGVEDESAAGSGAGEDVASIASALSVTQTFDIYDGTSKSISRTYGGSFLPSPINSFTHRVGQNSAQEKTTTSQVITYTTNPQDPYGQAKTCTWSVTTSYNSGYCSVNAYASALGLQGASCPYSFGSINTSNCQFSLYLSLY